MVLNFINRKLFRKRNKVYFANLKSEQFKFKKTHEKYIEKIYRNEDGQPVYEYDFHETVSTDEKNKILSDTIFYISNNKLEYDLLTSDGDILLNKKRFDEAKKNI
ncbi:MAG: hypothetical protein ABI840_10150 [bacterium]